MPRRPMPAPSCDRRLDARPRVRARSVYAVWIGVAVVLVHASQARAQSTSGPVQQVIAGAGLDIDAALSPDGASIAYASSRDGALEIWMHPLAGGPLFQVTSSVSNSADRFPVFTPDGKTIVFQSDRADGTRNIWSINLGNRALAQLTDFSDGAASHPAISRDGKTICFTHTNTQGDLAIWLMGSDGREQRELGTGFDCAWTPDGRIVFARARGANEPVRSDILIMDATGQHAQVISQSTQRWCRSPAVSPDGRWVVYTAYSSLFGSDIEEVPGGFQIDPGLRTSLWEVPLAGTSLPARELVSATSFNSYATWSRDGRTLLFTSTRSGSADVWSIAVRP